MPHLPQPKSYPSPPPSATPSRGEPRFLDQVANACRLKHLSYRRRTGTPNKLFPEIINLSELQDVGDVARFVQRILDEQRVWERPKNNIGFSEMRLSHRSLGLQTRATAQAVFLETPTLFLGRSRRNDKWG